MATTKRTSPRNTRSRTNVNMAKGSARTKRVLRTQPRALAFAVGAALFHGRSSTRRSRKRVPRRSQPAVK